MSRFVLTAQLQLQAPNNVRQVVQQIQSQLSGVNVNVQVQGSAQAQRQLQQVTQQANQATTAAERMGKAFALSIRRFAAFSIATRAVGLFTSTLGDAVNTAIDFERQLIKVAQVTGKSVGQLRGLTKQISSLSTGFGVASSDLLEVSTVLAQAGLTAEDTSVALRTLAKAALAPNFDSITETAEGAIAILAQFQEGVGSLEKQLGSINAVAGAFAVEASDLIDVVRRTGGVFKASGGSLNELLALFTSVRATTRESAESIGTGLRTIFTRIQRPKTIEFLKQFGVELVDLNGKFVGPYEAIKRLSEALSGLGEGDLTFISIAEELGGFRQIGKVLPLLQQFSTAQSALNVAMKAGDSLTQDAASAQAALAIRIMKVKEEFLSLIRSITETSTFQIMANSALSLASALIKIADSIKPLLPMLGALAAVRLAKGMAGFFGGMMSGAASGRTYNKGGKVLGFARGGLVPGTGNRDTVPAMLSPGEFVIRKSSVNKMGAGTLAAMNENRYAAGGVAEKIAAARNQSGLLPKKQSRDLKSIAIKTPQFGKESEVGIATSSYLPSPAKTNITIDREKIADQSIGDLGFKLSTKYGKNTLSYVKQVYKGKPTLSYDAVAEGIGLDKEKQFKTIIDQSIGSAVDIASQRFASEVLGSNLSKSVPKLPSFYNTLDQGFRGQLFENVITALSGKPLSGQDSRRPFDFTKGIGKFKSIYSNLGMNYVDAKISSGAAGVGIRGFGTDGITGLKTKILSQLAKEAIPAISLIERQAGEIGTLTTQGKRARKHFGGMIQKFAGGGEAKTPELYTRGTLTYSVDDMKAAAQRNGMSFAQFKAMLDERQDNMWKDFVIPPHEVQRRFGLSVYRPPSPYLDKVEAAKIQKEDRIASWKQKQGMINRDYEGQSREEKNFLAARGRRRRFATGGGVGTDTVPALLTPGEFVINRSSAQRIGYGNLNRMNKVGKYAKGGVVQHFAKGTSGTGAKSVISNFPVPGFDTKTPTIFNKILGKLSGTMSIFDMDLQTAAKQFDVLKRYMPAIGKAILNYADANNLTSKQVAQLGSAYYQVIQKLKQDNASTDRIIQVMSSYHDSLVADTQAKRNSAKATINATQASRIGMSTQDVLTAARSQSSVKNPFASMGGTMGQQSQKTSGVKDLDKNAKSAAKSMQDMANNNKMFIASMATSLIQGFLPAIDESSSSALKLTHGFLGLITTITSVGFALESFGMKLSAKGLMNFASGKGFGVGSMKQMMGGFRSMGLSKGMSSSLTGGIQVTAKVAGPLLAAAAAAAVVTEGFNAIVSSMYDYNAQLKKAIDSGNISRAEEYAGKQYDVDAANSTRQAFGYGGAAIGGAIGSIFGPIGTIAGAAIGAAAGVAIGTILASVAPGWAEAITVAFGGNTRDSTIKLAAAQAGAIRTQKELDAAQQLSTSLMKDFQAGLISSIEVFRQVDAKNQVVAQQQVRVNKAISSNIQNKSEYNGLINGQLSASGGTGLMMGPLTGLIGAIGGDAALRNTMTLGGVLGESSWARNQRIDKENADLVNKSSIEQARSFDIASESRTAMMRSRLFTNTDPEAARAEAKKTLLDQRQNAMATAKIAAKSGDEETYQAAIDQMEQIRKQIEQVDKEFANLEKEVKAAKEKFAALNLGFRSVISSSDAAAVKMTNLMSSFEVGTIPAVQAAATLEAAMTSAGQNINELDFNSSLNEINNVFKEFGASGKQIEDFNNLVKGVAGVQKEFPSIFDKLKASLSSGELKDINDPSAVGKKFKDIVAKQLEDANIDKGARDKILAAMGSVKLEPEDIAKIMAGDYSVLEKYLGDAAEEVKKNMKSVVDNYVKVQQELINATKRRIEAERSLVEAQKEALDLVLEGREIQGKYGGRAVTTRERRENLLAKSNVEASRLGLTSMRTGDVGDLRRRNAEIMSRFSGIEAQRGNNNGLQKAGGVEADETQKDLQKAYKTQIETIRGLIKLEEEQLKITQEKNKLEKDSMESLIKGDIEEFFKKQSAVGATAAIASGDQRLMRLYGTEALGTAAMDIQRQQEAGVQTLYGQQLGGRGGLAESAAAAALASRGITDMRSAQVMAGTTPEEEASKARLRELGGMLGETGMVGEQMAEMQLNTAKMVVEKAEMVVTNLATGGSPAVPPAVGKASGGLIYANRGIFVPRGTDTVPAMLTPGEFVVNRAAVQRGNNLQVLQAMNNGSGSVSNSSNGAAMMARGGMVRYRADGSSDAEKPSQGMTSFANALENFNRELSKNVESLKNTQISIKLDSTSVSINLNDGGLLKALTSQVKGELFKLIESEFKVDNGGRLRRNTSVLG